MPSITYTKLRCCWALDMSHEPQPLLEYREERSWQLPIMKGRSYIRLAYTFNFDNIQKSIIIRVRAICSSIGSWKAWIRNWILFGRTNFESTSQNELHLSHPSIHTYRSWWAVNMPVSNQPIIVPIAHKSPRSSLQNPANASKLTRIPFPLPQNQTSLFHNSTNSDVYANLLLPPLRTY